MEINQDNTVTVTEAELVRFVAAGWEQSSVAFNAEYTHISEEDVLGLFYDRVRATLSELRWEGKNNGNE